MTVLDLDEEVVRVSAKPLPNELQEYVGSLRSFFSWLRQPSNSQAAELFVAVMSNGGTVKQFMLELFEEENQQNHPWNMLDDPFFVRTVTLKASEWLKGVGEQHTSELEFADQLRTYQSPS
jgi:hypothetical protein